MEEIWKDIKGYEGLYQISNYGRVMSFYKSSKTGGGILQKQIYKGYEFVNLYKNGARKTPKIHRLVAEAFIPNPDGHPFVNHKNEIKNDNIVTNLEWCTPKYNSNYGDSINRRLNTMRKNGKRFICVETGKTYTMIVDCAREMNCIAQDIRKVLNGEQRQHKGYHFNYI